MNNRSARKSRAGSAKVVLLLALGLCTVIGGAVVAQRFQRGQRFGGYQRQVRLVTQPMWPANEEFKNDVFTFARVQYTSSGQQWGQPQWSVDYPDSDLNLSYRLKELTSLEVNPLPVVVRFDSPEIFDYPFVYLIEPGLMSLTLEEVEGFRRYIERGGFVMVDDFWGERERRVFESEMARVFPDRKMEDVPIEHKIFNLVYQISEKPQIPSIGHFRMGYTSDHPDADHANYFALKDDDGRIVVMVCHNTDTGDGWEREGEDSTYFERFSEKYAYPLGINIVMYAMTQ